MTTNSFKIVLTSVRDSQSKGVGIQVRECLTYLLENMFSIKLDVQKSSTTEPMEDLISDS